MTSRHLAVIIRFKGALIFRPPPQSEERRAGPSPAHARSVVSCVPCDICYMPLRDAQKDEYHRPELDCQLHLGHCRRRAERETILKIDRSR